MRRRPALLLVLMLSLSAAFWSLGSPAGAADDVILAQETGEEDEGPVEEEGGEAQESESDPAAETGADQGEDVEGEGAAEEGPVWTYQMAKIVIVLLLLMGLAIGGAYWRFVMQRQKTGV